MESSLHNPFAFFEYFTSTIGFEKCLDDALMYADYNNIKICKKTSSLEYIEVNEYGKHELKKLSFESLFKSLLIKEVEQSKDLLKEYSIHSSNALVSKYLKIQINSLQQIVNENLILISYNRYVLTTINKLVDFINDVLIIDNSDPFVLNVSHLENIDTITLDSKETSSQTLIMSIFGYMKGNNEKGVKILSDNDFLKLIEYTTHLIEEESNPKVEEKLRVNLNTDVLSYSYWVLHKNFYTSKKIRDYFYSFLMDTFSNFEKQASTSIKSSFGSKTRVPRLDILPKIIQDSF